MRNDMHMIQKALLSTEKTVKFYEERFPSVGQGASHVINAVPFLYAEVLRTLMARFGERPILRFFEKVSFRSKSRIPTGEHVSVVSTKLKVDREIIGLPLFSRVVLEIWYLGATGGTSGKNFMDERKNKLFKPEITDLSRVFYERYFENVYKGAIFVCEQFPFWYEDAMGRANAGVVNKIGKLMENTLLDQPELAGSYILADLDGADKKLSVEIDGLDVFERACLEIRAAGMNAKGLRKSKDRTVRVLPDVRRSTVEQIARYFPSPQSGVETLVEAFPVLLERTVVEEIEALFTQDELKFIQKTMGMVRMVKKEAKRGKPLGNTAGGLLIPACRMRSELEGQEIDQLLGKLNHISPFARMCLELGLIA